MAAYDVSLALRYCGKLNAKGWASAAGYGGKILAILQNIMQVEAETVEVAPDNEIMMLLELNERLSSENEELRKIVSEVAELVNQIA